MPRPSSKHPTELELEILKILWRCGPLPVREVRDALADFRELATTSVTTVMNIMVRKKYLRRNKQDAAYVYYPEVSEGATTGRMLRDVVERAFDGSATAVMLRLLESNDLNETEMTRIRTFLDRQKGSDEK